MAIEIQNYAPFINDASLVAYYRFEGNANDSKGTNNGTAPNVIYGTQYGKFGQGANFAGTNSEISIPNTAGISLVTLTAGISFNLSSTFTTEQILFRKDTNSPRSLRGITRISQTAIRAQVYNGATSWNIDYTFIPGIWYNAVITLSGVSGTLSLYINGALVSSIAVGVFTAPTTVLKIGNHCNTPGDTFTVFLNGNVDDFFLMNTVKTATEIANYEKASSTNGFFNF